MTTPVLLSRDGQRVSLGQMLGRGGEACVYEIAGQPDKVAKVYHKPADLSTAEKLAVMCDIGTERLRKLTAWPLTTLHDTSKRQTLGMLMPNVAGYKGVHLLYTPKSRFREFPAANWTFIVHTAANAARAFAAIHEHGIVVGDVNESNVMAAPKTAMVALIDCDSFQVTNGTRCYLCEVGTPTYTPPELQGKTFATVVRTTNHDGFGLAVMIFHLLFMGRHPFAGRFLGPGEMPLERAIGEFRFAFSRGAGQRQMQPPPGCLMLSDLPSELSELFEVAFSPAGAQSGRPPARQWVDRLTELESRLRSCGRNAAHTYFRELQECPWCRIERSGIVFFVSFTFATGASTLNIEQVWSEVCAITSPGPVPILLPIAKVTLTPSAAAQVAGKYRSLRWGAATVIVLAGFGLCFTAETILPLIVAALIAFGITKAKHNQGPFVAAVQGAQARAAAVQRQWNEQTGDTSFIRKRSELEQLRNELLGLPQLRLKRYQELERNKYNAQLSRFLERYSLENASVHGIGPGRKAILRSYGIDDADDVIKLRTQSVPGIGPNFTARLLLWRESLVNKFVFNPAKALDPNDVRRLDVEIANRRSSLERAVIDGATELKRIRAQVLASREALQQEYQIATRELQQAQTDLRAV